MYNPPIKGKAIKRIVSPVQRRDLSMGNGIDSVMKLVGELTFLKQQLQSTMDAKVEEIDNAIASVMEIKKGEQGDPGIDADEQKIADWVLSQVKDGEDGEDADTEMVIQEVLKRLPRQPNEAEIVAKVLKLIPSPKASLKVIKEELQLDKEALLEDILNNTKFKKSFEGINLTLERLDRRYIHGGGDTVGAGTNVTITTVNGTKIINATGSSAVTVLTATGTIDDSNTVFTFTVAPTLVNINGSFYSSTSTIGGTLAWTIAGLTVTLANPVGTGGSLFGLS